MLPIKKTKEAFARYLGKYLTKTFNLIEPGRKHRLVRYSRGIGRHLSIRFSIRGLGNLLHRTRLKMAAAMLNFKDYGYFADFFGPRWFYYLGDIISSIPIPLVFAKGNFESGVAAKLLAAYADDPLPYLDSETKKRLLAAHRMLWRKFEELAFDASAGLRWQESEAQEADNIDVGPVTEADLDGELFDTSGNPF